MPGRNNQASMEFKLIVQPESGVVEFVTHSSHLPLRFAVAPVSEAYFCTPLVIVRDCAVAAKDRSVTIVIVRIGDFEIFKFILCFSAVPSGLDPFPLRTRQ